MNLTSPAKIMFFPQTNLTPVDIRGSLAFGTFSGILVMRMSLFHAQELLTILDSALRLEASMTSSKADQYSAKMRPENIIDLICSLERIPSWFKAYLEN